MEFRKTEALKRNMRESISQLNHHLEEGCWQSGGRGDMRILWQFHAQPWETKQNKTNLPCKSWNHLLLLCLQNFDVPTSQLFATHLMRDFPKLKQSKPWLFFPPQFCDLAKLLIISKKILKPNGGTMWKPRLFSQSPINCHFKV